jgi:hypothetical protein
LIITLKNVVLHEGIIFLLLKNLCHALARILWRLFPSFPYAP